MIKNLTIKDSYIKGGQNCGAIAGCINTFYYSKPTVTKDGNTWVVRGDEVEKLLKMTKFSSEEAANRFANKLKKMGIDDKLRELGAVEGDNVRILDLEFEYKI